MTDDLLNCSLKDTHTDKQAMIIHIATVTNPLNTEFKIQSLRNLSTLVHAKMPLQNPSQIIWAFFLGILDWNLDKSRKWIAWLWDYNVKNYQGIQ